MTASTATASIRRLAAADATAWRLLMLQALTDEPDAFTSDVEESRALPPASWVQRTEAEHVLGAFVGDALAGVLALQFATRLRIRHKAVLSGLYVHSALRGRGLGGRLVDAAIAAARERTGLRVLQLQASAHNVAALALYASRGFVEFGREPLAVQLGAGFVTKVHLWRELT
jgi:ribosomal protein S18 acetylase RimI-like enzyme